MRSKQLFSICTVCLLALLSFSSCSRNSFPTLEDRTQFDTIPFDQLPKNVADKFVYSTGNQNKFFSCWSADSATVHIDDFFVLSADAVRHQSWKYGYYFKINGKKFCLAYTPMKPTPFVVDEAYVYWCTVANEHGTNCTDEKFSRVRWK